MIRFTRKTETHLCELSDRNLNLLAHAQTIELDIGSLCGGHGQCGGDRVKVSGSNLSAITESEKKHLTPEELAAGWRLACQCFPEISDSSFEIEFE